jgi:HK97 family phage major capsid protein
MDLRLKHAEKLDAAKKLREQMQAQLDAAGAAGRAMLDSERKQYDEWEVSHNSLLTECSALKADIDRQAKLAANDPKNFTLPGETVPDGRKTNPDTDKTKIGSQVVLSEKDPMRGFKRPSDFFHAVMLAKHPNGPMHLGDNGRKVRGVDQRLMCLQSRGDPEMLTAGSDESSTVSGEWFIPPAFHPDLLMIEPMFPAMQTRQIPMESPKVDIPARVDKDHSTSVTGGLVVTRRAEMEAMTASRMKTEPISLVCSGQYGLAYVTEELLNDSPLSIASLIEQGFGVEFEAATIRERLYGSGSGEYLGVMTTGCPCTITVTRDTTGTVLYTDVLAMVARLWGVTRPGTCWLYSPSTLPKLAQLTVGSLNWPVWMPSAREGEPDRLLGIPAYKTEFCKPLGTKGDLILGQWNEYLEGTYQQLQTAESIHVRFEYNERVYRFYRRNCGMPWWKSTMCPAGAAASLAAAVTAGTDLAPFVALSTK